jgi:uncharacterized delta-60 repeat protein
MRAHRSETGADVPMRNRLALLATALGGLACASGGSAPSDSGTTDPVATVGLSPASANVLIGTSATFTAVARDAAGQALTVPLSWSSSNTGVAAVDNTGRVQGISVGTAVITASAGGVTSLGSTVSVVQGLSAIALAPASLSVAQGGSASLTVTCTDSAGATVATPPLSWTSSAPAVASVNSAGEVLGLGSGSAQISASYQGVTSNTVQVLVHGGGHVSVTVSPPSATIPHGDTQVFTATVVGYATTAAVTWSVEEAGGGSLADGGSFTAGCPINAIVHVVATSVEDPSSRGLAAVTIGGQGAAGTPDVCFGNASGYVVSNIAAGGAANAVAIQPDGKVVVAGSASSATDAGMNPSQFAAVRYRTNGTLDPTFGSGGIATASDNANLGDQAQAVAIQADGKIVLAGSSDLKLALARFTDAGALDPLFGQSGIETVSLPGAYQSRAAAVALASDGSIAAAGQTITSLVPTFTSKMQWLQYGATGQLTQAEFDPSGSGNTKVTAIAVESMGGADAYLLAGTDVDAGVMIRVSRSGIQDTGFSPGPLGGRLSSVAVDASGNILVAGGPSQGSGFWVARLLPSGAADPTFGGGGSVTIGSGTLDRMAVQADGRVILAGRGTLGQLEIRRLLTGGGADPTFGTLGVVTLLQPFISSINGLALDSTGIVFAGSSGPGNFAAVRIWQ